MIGRQAEAIDDAVVVQALDLTAEVEEALAADLGDLSVGLAVGELGRDEAHVPADRDHVRDAVERDLDADFFHDVGDVAVEQRDLQFLRVAAEVELLAEPHRPERVDAGPRGLPAPERREAGAAAADLDQQRARRLERRVPAQRIPDGQVDEPALLRLVDHFEPDAGPALDAVEEHVGIARFAHRARRHRPDVGDAVAVHDVTEPVERLEGRIHGLRADDAAREGVAAQQDAARGFLDDPHVAPGIDLGHDEADCARTHVEHANQSGCGFSVGHDRSSGTARCYRKRPERPRYSGLPSARFVSTCS